MDRTARKRYCFTINNPTDDDKFWEEGYIPERHGSVHGTSRGTWCSRNPALARVYYYEETTKAVLDEKEYK